MVLYDQLKAAAIARGVPWNAQPEQLNIVGVRNTRDLRSNNFNDLICIAFIAANGRPSTLVCQSTTDPGVYCRENPANVAGTAILTDGYHKNLWKIGKHKGIYTALVQATPVSVWRDNNKDSQLDFDVPLQVGMFGINLHRANEHAKSTLVDKWSAGCQVVADPLQFSELIALARRHAALYGDSFDYTLLHDRDIHR